MKNNNLKRLLVIGAGPCGAATARICAENGFTVDLYDKRNHIGGNCFDENDENGVLVHRYGPHYFRTNNQELLTWLSRFTDWIPGRYYVRASVDGKLLPLPISLSTMTQLKGKVFTEEIFKEYLANHRQEIAEPANSEEQCLALVGRELYELLFKGYTQKQWNIHPRELAASITARIPLRFNWDERYPREKFQVMPALGYTHMFENILDHTSINLHLNSNITSDDLWKMRVQYNATLFTGPVDKAFDCCFGPLQYRSLRFEYQHYSQDYVQPCVQINYPNEHAYTRSVEIKHVTGQSCSGSTLVFEYPEQEGEEFYPLLTDENQQKLLRYQQRVHAELHSENPVYFVGRMAEFKYYNMDQAFMKGHETAERIINAS